MATQTDHGKRKGRAKIEAGGGGGGGVGGTIVIGCALIGAAIGAAFVAHRGRGSSTHRGRGRKVDQEEEKGLQTLLPSADRCGDRRETEASSVGSQESASDKSEIGDATESDKGSEGTGDSSAESGAEVVWPSEVIEQQKEFSQFEVDEPKQTSEVSEKYREEEFSFDSSVEIQETICMDPEIVNQIEADTTDIIDDNIVVEEFSFWSVKSSMPEIHTEQNLAESEIAHVPEEGKLELKEEIEEFQIKEEGEKREKGSKIIQASTETNEMKQQLQNSEKTEKISVSESEDSTWPLQNLLPTTYSVEQQKGHILVDSSEGTQNNAYSDLDKEMETSESHNTCENFEVVVETRKNQSETYMNANNNLIEESDISHIEESDSSCNDFKNTDMLVEAKEKQSEADTSDDNGLVQEPDISHEDKEEEEEGSCVNFQEEIEMPVKDAGEKGEEESEGLPLVENEMKLQSEIAKKTTGIVDIGQAKKDEDEVHEQEVLKKEPGIMLTDKEKRMDFMLAGSSKIFLLVLALTLALGLLAFAHHDHLHNYKRHLPEIYRQLSQLFFPSHNGGIGEL